MKKQAKRYNSLSWWEFYKTEDGHSFTVRDNKEYWYNGNVLTNDETNQCFIKKKYHKELFDKIEFIK